MYLAIASAESKEISVGHANSLSVSTELQHPTTSETDTHAAAAAADELSTMLAGLDADAAIRAQLVRHTDRLTRRELGHATTMNSPLSKHDHWSTK